MEEKLWFACNPTKGAATEEYGNRMLANDDSAEWARKKLRYPTLWVVSVVDLSTGEANNSTIPLCEALKDENRIGFHYRHIQFVHKAIQYEPREGEGLLHVDVHGVPTGFKVRFSLIYIDIYIDCTTLTSS
ncbi:hypothetical protein E2562_001693 [Oryza meyeriana var. granulata]|uniref:Uncharacterized protein n=1 Tax=Oryza meyeriana var. granulata TaxID=110450 RepID=A0A6G1CD84_9ORYZ|nr:hypothetical protein E2562_001693 [Oryza meyeriana var. granulata]